MNECDGEVSVIIEVVGSLQREVVIYLSTSDQTAYGDLYVLTEHPLRVQQLISKVLFVSTADVNYGRVSQPLTFDSVNNAITVNVSIFINMSETSHEMDEHFTVSIAFPGEKIPRVLLEPDSTNVTIFEASGQGEMHVYSVWSWTSYFKIDCEFNINFCSWIYTS